MAFIVPLCLPVIGAATLHNENWYYPAFMIVVGAHYVPFVFLYGLREYAGLAAALIGGGVVIGIALPGVFAVGGWLTGIALVLFAIVIRRHAAQEAPPRPARALGARSGLICGRSTCHRDPGVPWCPTARGERR